MRIGHKNRNDNIGPIALYDFRQSLTDSGEPAQRPLKIRTPIDPGISGRPNARRAIDPDEISAPYDFVESSKRFRKQVAAFDGRVGRNLRERVANSTCGAVMSFAKTGGK